MTEVINPIHANLDVLGFYHKQKSEFHFNEKTDNEFLMFLLDTAVRVISIVQHLAPVIEAVSDASIDEALDDYKDYNDAADCVSDKIMEIERVDKLVEDMAQQHMNLPSTPLPPQVTKQKSRDSNLQPQPPISVPMSIAAQPSPATLISLPTTIQTTLSLQNTVPLQTAPLQTAPPIMTPAPTTQTAPTLHTHTHHSPAPAAHQSENNNDLQDFKSEAIAEVFVVKDELVEPMQVALDSVDQPLLPPETINQLMTSINANEENVGIANLVTTAQPSNLPSSFLEKSNNPLSMLSLTNTANSISLLATKTAGLCTQAESVAGSSRGHELKSLTDMKGGPSNSSSNPKKRLCPYCLQGYSFYKLKRHIDLVHLKVRPFKCFFCDHMFGTIYNRKMHMKRTHKHIEPSDICKPILYE